MRVVRHWSRGSAQSSSGVLLGAPPIAIIADNIHNVFSNAIESGVESTYFMGFSFAWVSTLITFRNTSHISIGKRETVDLCCTLLSLYFFSDNAQNNSFLFISLDSSEHWYNEPKRSLQSLWKDSENRIYDQFLCVFALEVYVCVYRTLSSREYHKSCTERTDTLNANQSVYVLNHRKINF